MPAFVVIALLKSGLSQQTEKRGEEKGYD